LTIVMLKTGKNREDSQKLLAQEHGNVSQILKEK
ncbi:MAG TPA: N-acetylmuramic acid 6-phosphate etherase, partial [Lactobacillus acetotolerans]|nr:N-acetylmuramic acid 6-phosphate etherase [Lactobacillus acetotolerans]